jgi:outer membrane protein, multidrug efflux system
MKALTLPRTALLFSLLLAGCAAVGPDYERPAIDRDLPATYPAAGAAGAGGAIDVAWWKLYGDAALDALVERALERNADIRLAVARIEEADANLREAGAAFLPQIDLGAAGSRSGVSTTGAVPVPSTVPVIRSNVRLTASTSFELDFWGRLRRALEAARAQALGTRYAKDVVSLSLAGLTSQAYFSLRSLDVQIALTRDTLAVRDEYLGIVRSRAAGGIASDLDVNQAVVSRADAAAQLRDLQRQRALAEHQLATLAGKLDLTLPQSANLLALPVPPAPPPGLPATLLERRPDLRQAEQQLVSANAQIGVARAAMLPTISLTGSYGAESQALSTLLQSGSNIWSLGFGLALPIFDWGRLAARADAAEARAHQSLAAYQKAIETAFREVADGLTNLEQTTTVEEDLQGRAAAARNTLGLARARYEAGYSPYLELLDAQRTLNDAELAVVRNRQSRLAASVDLMKSLGGGWSPEAPVR